MLPEDVRLWCKRRSRRIGLGGNWIGESIQSNTSAILPSTIDPDSIDIDLFFLQQWEESDIWAIDPIQVGSRMSQLLHPAACDYSVAMPRCQGYTPALYFTFCNLLTNASTSSGLTLWRGTRWGMSKGPVDLLSRLHVQRTPPFILGSWFLDSPVRKGERK